MLAQERLLVVLGELQEQVILLFQVMPVYNHYWLRLAAAVGYTAAGGSFIILVALAVNTTGSQVTGQAGTNYGCGGSGGCKHECGRNCRRRYR